MLFNKLPLVLAIRLLMLLWPNHKPTNAPIITKLLQIHEMD